ncbi:uncharacterized protein LOC117106056 [Anneissia japonica]|uniref:uncharacterized protein LOC117106056 n=1 Tax=Anneissia japonica TaxID=1529436 RepID=UPI001425728C|nr:uncharacterized protein LOC117106056 [Anneissia japonica]
MADQKSEQKNTSDQIIERLPLEHPLPKEIQRLPKDDTVCKFCGISYFIHHEVKALEEKVISLEKDLVDYQAAIEREVTLKNEIKSCQEKLAKNQALIKNKEEE